MSIKKTQQKGFTLIEMLDSVALFSVVLVVTLGSILTIMDSNKKARSLMSVMNNLNFSIDSMTRSIKAGKITGTSVSGGGDCFQTEQINYDAGGFIREDVKYCLVVVDGIGKIEKTVAGINTSAITAPDVDIDYLKFTEHIQGLSASKTGEYKISQEKLNEFKA